jgi:hypothetical protein
VMDATHRQKRSAADSIDPLNAGILQNVLSYVGLGHHLFVAPVSKLWRDLYSTVQTHQLTVSQSRRRKMPCVPQTTLYSAAFASPSRLRLAHENGFSCTSRKHLLSAGRFADVATLASAHELGMQYTVAVMAGAARYKKLAEVQYLHEQGCPWSRTLLEGAAIRGHLELVRWCYEHGCPWPDISKASNYVAESGNVELMAWVLQQPGAQLQATAMKAAVSKGRADMCKYLHAQHCPWDTNVTAGAARAGHVDLLCWLIDNGCPWAKTRLCLAAASSGNIELMTFLQQQGLPTSAALLTDMLNYASSYNKLAAAKWLRQQGAEWPSTFRCPWRGEVLEWARAEGCMTHMN